MRNKYLIIFLFTLAQTLFLGHSIIPHQHLEPHTHHHGSHHHHDHDSPEDEENGLVHLFCEFNHAGNSTEFLGSFLGSNIEKTTPTIYFLIQETVSQSIKKSNLRQKTPPEHFHFYNFYIFLPSGLRGPPNLVA